MIHHDPSRYKKMSAQKDVGSDVGVEYSFCPIPKPEDVLENVTYARAYNAEHQERSASVLNHSRCGTSFHRSH